MQRELDLPDAIAAAIDELAAGRGRCVDEIVAQALTLYLNFSSAPDETLAELMQIRARPEPLETARVVTQLLEPSRRVHRDRAGGGPAPRRDAGAQARTGS